MFTSVDCIPGLYRVSSHLLHKPAAETDITIAPISQIEKVTNLLQLLRHKVIGVSHEARLSSAVLSSFLSYTLKLEGRGSVLQVALWVKARGEGITG